MPNTGASNTAIGDEALTLREYPQRLWQVGSVPKPAIQQLNAGNGHQTGEQITSGTETFAVGTVALDTCTSGINNTAVGASGCGGSNHYR